MSARERRNAAYWALAIATMLSLPYLFAWGITPPERAFLGLIWNPDEPNVYYSWMRQAADGRLFLQDLFTTEPQAGRFTNVFFLALGWVAAVTRLPVPWVYALARFGCAAFLYYSLWVFVARRGGSPPLRRAAVVLGATASGLGWLVAMLAPGGLIPAGVSCVDVGLASGAAGRVTEGLMMPEANTLASALLLPLFSFSMALLLWLVDLGARAMEGPDLKAALGAGLLGLLLGSIHTYDVIPMHLLLGLLALFWAVRGRSVRPLLAYVIFAAVSVPTLLYQVWVFGADEVFRQKAVTVTASPSPLSYAVSFGIPLGLALCGLVLVARRREARWLPVAAWLVLGLAVAFLPGLSFQRKMIEGTHLPMVILAAVTLVRWLPMARRRTLAGYRRRAVAWTMVAATACAPSSAYFLGARCLATVAENNQSRQQVLMPPYTLSRDDLAAARWLREHARRDDAILCLPFLGSYLPGLTGRKVYIGHWAETLRFAEEKLPAALGALRGDARGRTALDDCAYLVVGEYENAWGARPAGEPLEEAFRSGATVVYRIRP
jgi:hypothetical protein